MVELFEIFWSAKIELRVVILATLIMGCFWYWQDNKRKQKEKYQERLKASQENRSKQFANYLSMIDAYSKKRVSLKGSMVQLGNLKATSGRLSGPKTTKMSTIMDNYHDKALRLAQAKYYQKSVG